MRCEVHPLEFQYRLLVCSSGVLLEFYVSYTAHRHVVDSSRVLPHAELTTPDTTDHSAGANEGAHALDQRPLFGQHHVNLGRHSCRRHPQPQHRHTRRSHQHHHTEFICYHNDE